MAIEVIDYIDVEQRATDLGIKTPEGFCILPRRFEHAKAVEDMCHEASALDLKVLFRKENLPIAVYQPDGKPIRVIKENDNTWIGPVLFVSYAAFIQNPHVLSVALSVIANYVTDLFRGSPERALATMSVVIENNTTETTTSTKTTKTTETTNTKETTSRVTKEIKFTGTPDKITEIYDRIKDMK